MARSSTSYRPKWRLGRTTVIRVPQTLVPVVLRYAHDLDERPQRPKLRGSGVAGGNAEDFQAAKRRKGHSIPQRSLSGSSRFQITSRGQSPRLRCDIRATFATAFRNWRLGEGIPLKKLAADLGLTVATISLWELGKRFPSARHFEMLMNYTGMPPCRLFCVLAEKCVPAECLLAVPWKP